MKNIATVFDTNAYRYLCGPNLRSAGWTAAALATRESQQGITSYANPFVILELASHLWDASKPAYMECRAALAAIYDHCRIDRSDEFRIIADTESLIARMLFDKEPDGSADLTHALAKFTAMVAREPGHLSPAIAKDSKMLADALGTREAAFVADMKAMVERLNPSAVGWNPFAKDAASRKARLADVRSRNMLRSIALGYVLKARRQLGMPMTASTLEDETDAVLTAGGASIALYREILDRLISTGCDMTKDQRQNWIWDMQIAFPIGQPIGEPPQRCVLVTADQAILDAACAAG